LIVMPLTFTPRSSATWRVVLAGFFAGMERFRMGSAQAAAGRAFVALDQLDLVVD